MVTFKECTDLISRMLTVDRTQRATIEEIKSHSWITFEKQEKGKLETVSPSSSVLFEREIFDC